MISIPEQLITLPDGTQGIKAMISYYESPGKMERGKVALSTFLFSFILSGNKKIQHLRDFTNVSPDEFLLLKPSHCLMTERMGRDETYRALLFFFQAESFIDLDFINVNDSSSQVPDQDFLVLPRDAYVTNFLQSILYLRRSGVKLVNDIILIKLQELLRYLIIRHGEVVAAFLLSNLHSRPEQRIRRVAEQHVDQKLNIEELAFLSQMSVSTFNRKFKEIFGVSPSKWFLKQRLLKARQHMLQLGKYPSDVFSEAGFENFSSFSQAFKKEFGELPSQVLKD